MEISVNAANEELLNRLAAFFNGGYIYSNGSGLTLRVSNIVNLMENVIPHFKVYPLCSQKQVDYDLWVSAVTRLSPLSLVGSIQDVTTPAAFLGALNTGITTGLSSFLSEGMSPVPRGPYVIPASLSPWWISGFMSCAATFSISLRPSGQFSHIFSVSQHIRDLPLINLIQAYFNCGKVYTRSDRCDYLVQTRGHINNVIIPFFTEYPLISVKTLDFNDFAQALALHGTLGWKEKVKTLADGMNTKRNNNT